MALLVPRLACAAALIALPAVAETTHGWVGGYSHITIQPTDAPGAVAEVVFVNRTVHVDQDLTFVLDLDGLAVTVDAMVGRGLTPDRMTVTAPVGFIAVPSVIDVPEEETGVILIYEWAGM